MGKRLVIKGADFSINGIKAGSLIKKEFISANEGQYAILPVGVFNKLKSASTFEIKTRIIPTSTEVSGVFGQQNSRVSPNALGVYVNRALAFVVANHTGPADKLHIGEEIELVVTNNSISYGGWTTELDDLSLVNNDERFALLALFTETGIYQPCQHKILSYTIIADGKVIFNATPAEYDGKGCLYDRISGECIYDASGNGFVVG